MACTVGRVTYSPGMFLNQSQMMQNDLFSCAQLSFSILQPEVIYVGRVHSIRVRSTGAVLKEIRVDSAFSIPPFADNARKVMSAKGK